MRYCPVKARCRIHILSLRSPYLRAGECVSSCPQIRIAPTLDTYSTETQYAFGRGLIQDYSLAQNLRHRKESLIRWETKRKIVPLQVQSLLITNISKVMKHLLSILLVAVTLIGTSSFTYETTSTTNTESISIQKQKKHSGRKTHKRSKTRKYRTRKNQSTRSASIGQTVYITPTGSCYHSTPSCPALWRGNYSRISLSSARNEGYRSCSRCY